MIKYEKKILSQGGQDGIIEHLFDRIGTINNPPFYVEFGFNSADMTGGTGANVANLFLNKGWKGLLLDGNFSNPAINLHKEFITSENICELFRKYHVPIESDYVSIDIDSCDLWIFRKIISEYRPRVVSVEYNGHFRIDSAITFPDNPVETWQYDRVYGASLKALRMVGEEFGYKLVHVVSNLDLFFVRDDLWLDPVPSLKDFGYASGTYFAHPPCRSGRENIMIDYETWRMTGNMDAAKKAAQSQIHLLTQLP